jgi:hypothetical protein
MNVDQIYQFHLAEAFAKQFTAPSYTTFVAMPFGRTDGYDADDIYRRLKEEVHLLANKVRQESQDHSLLWSGPPNIKALHSSSRI